MPSNFDLAFEHFVKSKLEGGYIDNHDDPGGETKFGISKRSYPNLDIKNLTLEKAKELYHDEWWEKSYEDIPSDLATEIFDLAINAGTFTAHLTLQRTINALGGNIDTDSIIGPQTVGAIKSLEELYKKFIPKPAQILVNQFQLLAIDYYLHVSDGRARRGCSNDFMRSWVRRVRS